MHVAKPDTAQVLPVCAPHPDLVLQMQIINSLGKKEDQFWFKTDLLHAVAVFSSEGAFQTTPASAQPRQHICLSEG